MRKALFLWSVCIFMTACGKGADVENGTETNGRKLFTQKLDEKGLDIETIDINRDGRTDQWIYRKDDGTIRYAQRDLNFDGIIDLTEFYEGGKRVRDEIDLDYDGIVDLVITYREGIVEKKEYSVDFEGNRHGIQYFNEKGERIEIHRDTDGDGRLDTIEYYEPGKVDPVRVEKKDVSVWAK